VSDVGAVPAARRVVAFGWTPGRRVVDPGCAFAVFRCQSPRLDETWRLPRGSRQVAVHACITRPVLHSCGGFSAGVRVENPPQKWRTGSPSKVRPPAGAIRLLRRLRLLWSLWRRVGEGRAARWTVRQDMSVGAGAVGSAPERKGAICVRCLEVLYLLRCSSLGPVGRFGDLGGVRGRQRRARTSSGGFAQAVEGSYKQWRVRTGRGGCGQVVACPRSPLLVLTLQFVPESHARRMALRGGHRTYYVLRQRSHRDRLRQEFGED
jgi:hypothetical protein